MAGHVEDRWYTTRDGLKLLTARHGTGKRYRVRYVADGRERSGGSFARKTDADRRLVELRAGLLRGQWVGPTDQTRERIPPKTPRSRRMVPLPAMVAVALSEHIREFAPAPDGLLFHTRTGAPYLYGSYQRVFGKAVAHAKLPATGTHDLRHHYASVLLAADESVVALPSGWDKMTRRWC